MPFNVLKLVKQKVNTKKKKKINNKNCSTETNDNNPRFKSIDRVN